MSKLRILQYNVRKSKKVMEPLLADAAALSYDTIALQEPWKNPLQNRTYCPRASGYIPAYDNRERRCCFLVHKDLNTAMWDIEFLGPDLAVLQYRTTEQTIWVYNVYSEPPGGYIVTEYSTPIPQLAELFEREGEHILLGDFNLHHPMWSGVRNPTIHAAAELLAQLVAAYGMTLASLRGGVT